MCLSKLITLIGCFLLLAGCADGEEAAKKAVLDTLKNPDSAKFGKFTKMKTKDGTSVACLTVNAKNSIDGSVGDQQAMMVLMSGRWDVIGGKPQSFTHDECVGLLSLH